jgi:hypothetical protein
MWTNEILSREHVPPQSAGGKRMLVTCRGCNNRAGTELDSHALLADRRMEFLQRRMTKPAAAEITFDGVTMQGEVLATERNIHVDPLRKLRRSPSEVVEAFRRRWAESSTPGGQPITMDIKPRWRIDAQASNVSRLRSAYLAAFAFAGYDYILTEELHPIRRHILSRESSELDGYGAFSQKMHPNHRSMMIVERPEKIRSLAVLFGGWIIFLPWYGGPADLYHELALIRSSSGSDFLPSLEGMSVPWPTEPMHLSDLASPEME